MYPRNSRIRRISFAAALLCLGAGLTASAAGTASAATQGSTIAVHTDGALSAAASPPLSIVTAPEEETTPDTAVTLDVRYSDTDSSATVTFSATDLPPGLSIDHATGVISGTTSSTIGTYDVTISAIDSDGNTASAQVTWTIENLIAVRPVTLTGLTVGKPVNVTVTASDSALGVTLSYSASGSLPAGLSLDSTTGVISGTPTTIGSGTVTFTAADGTGSSETGPLEKWSVGGKVTVSGIPARTTTAGQTVALPVSATDNPSEPLTYQGFNLPPGVTLNGPEIIGWPATPGTYNVALLATDPYGSTGSTSFTWTVTDAADSGPNGPVGLNLGGKCLDDTGNSSANGNKVQVWTCNGGAAQKWTYAEDGTLRIHGKCLDVIGRGTSSGTGVQIWSCTGAANQQWVADTDTQFVNPAADLCLTDPGGSTANGTKLQINSCGTGTRDEWTIPAGAVLSAISGRCMDDLGNSTANGAKVDAYNCNGGNPQKWTLAPDGTIRVNGKCLDDTDDSSTSGTKIQLWNCNGGASQRWTEKVSISPLGIELQHGSLCVSPTSMTAANGAQLVLGTCGSEEGNWHAW